MANMVNIFLFGKKYEVPDNLTIMNAMEYAGYQLVRGCGCRNGFCGACATIYRIKGDKELKACLACQTKVEDNMYIATLPFFPLVKQVYDINKVPVTETVMMQLYPEIYACIGCNACTKACISHPQVAMLARRIHGKYLAPDCGHLNDRVREIKDGTFNELIEALMQKPIEEMKELYNTREIEK